MRKTINLILIGVMAVFYLFQPKEMTAFADSNNDTYIPENAVGCGINLLDCSSLKFDDLIHTSVFNQNVKDKYHIFVNEQADDKFFSSLNYTKISKQITSRLFLNSDLGIPYDNLSILNQIQFGLNDSKNLSLVSNSYFYYRTTIRILRSAELMDALNYSLYRNSYLSENFISAINMISNSSGSKKTALKNLFTRFGTHIIVGGNLGGRAELKYGFYSDKYLLESTSEIDNAFKIALKEEDFQTNFESRLKIFNIHGNSEKSLRIQTFGGTEMILGQSPKDYDAMLEQWEESVGYENASLVSLMRNGVVPIWQYIADAGIRKEAELLFNELYAKSEFNPYNSESCEFTSSRYQSQEVNFGGGSNVRWENFTMPSPAKMIEAGYNNVRLTFLFSLKRKNWLSSNDCYISVYNGETQLLFKNCKISSYSFTPFEMRNVNDIKLADLTVKNGAFKTKFDAYGTGTSHFYGDIMLICQYYK